MLLTRKSFFYKCFYSFFNVCFAFCVLLQEGSASSLDSDLEMGYGSESSDSKVPQASSSSAQLPEDADLVIEMEDLAAPPKTTKKVKSRTPRKVKDFHLYHSPRPQEAKRSSSMPTVAKKAGDEVKKEPSLPLALPVGDVNSQTDKSSDEETSDDGDTSSFSSGRYTGGGNVDYVNNEYVIDIGAIEANRGSDDVAIRVDFNSLPIPTLLYLYEKLGNLLRRHDDHILDQFEPISARENQGNIDFLGNIPGARDDINRGWYYFWASVQGISATVGTFASIGGFICVSLSAIGVFNDGVTSDMTLAGAILMAAGGIFIFIANKANKMVKRHKKALEIMVDEYRISQGLPPLYGNGKASAKSDDD